MRRLKMKLVEKYPLLGSSKQDGTMSLTWQGILVGLVPLAVYCFNQFGVEITADLLLELIEKGLAVGSSVAVFIGVVRKISLKVQR